MHQLSRCVRFCINPFLSVQPSGFNGFGARPAGQGLAIFLELGVSLKHTVNADTGFVINVIDIDSYVRQFAVPVFVDFISKQYAKSSHISLVHLKTLLSETFSVLKQKFVPCTLTKLDLKLTPFRTMTMKSESSKTVFYSEKFEFAAMHKLWNERFTTEENIKAFGKCANASGHGHNYWIEVTVQTDTLDQFNNIEFEKIVNDRFIDLMDHKNLNADVPHFKTHIPTIENISQYAWQCLNSYFRQCQLDSVTVWESDRTCCTYSMKK